MFIAVSLPTAGCNLIGMKTGDRIAKARAAKGMSQSELARALGVKPQAVQAWESGRTAPRSSRLQQVAQLLNVSIGHLLCEPDDGVSKDTKRQAQQSSFALETLKNLQGVATPRTLAVLDRIERAAKDGRLHESDLVLLEEIAQYLERKNDTP